MLIQVKASQAEMDEMQMTPDQLAAAIVAQLNEGVPFEDGSGRIDLAGFNVEVLVGRDKSPKP